MDQKRISSKQEKQIIDFAKKHLKKMNAKFDREISQDSPEYNKEGDVNHS